MADQNQSQPPTQTQSRLVMPQPRAATASGDGGTPRSSVERGDPRVHQNASGVLTSPGPPAGVTSSFGPGSLGYQNEHGEGEGSRRVSQDRPRSNANSVNHSPTSAASSSRHVIHGGQGGNGGMLGPGGGSGNLWPGGAGANGATSKLPRITTSIADGNEVGPRSAPVTGPLRIPLSSTSGPMRSSTSPDPYTASGNSDRGSPIDGRAPGPPPALGQPYYPAPSLQFPTPQLPAPPRRSSHQNHQAAQSHTHSTPHAPERQDRSLGSTSSHHSLSASKITHEGAAASAAYSETPRGENDRDVRATRSRDPTYCGQCDLVVHGQFVRAMGKVYHLNCFRCKVS